MVVHSPRLRTDLAHIPAYRAGTRAQHESLPSYSLASNETVFGPLPGVAEQLQEALSSIHRYPDPAASQLIDALARHLHVGVDEISVGTGSVAVCQQVIVAACTPGDEVIYAWRSFEAYPILTALAGATSRQIPLLPNGSHDLMAMAAAVTDRTRVIFVCTPNNPTGPAVTATALEEFLDRIPDTVLVVIDEAYFEFGFQDGAPPELDAVAMCRGRANVVVLRTFSKAYGLAGLRIGYAIASPVVTTALRKVALPFGASSLGQAAALLSLNQQDALRERVASVQAERAGVIAQARDLGFAVPDSHGNFYWLPLGASTEKFAQACTARGVTVRAFAGEGVRVTVGEPAANDIVLAVLGKFGAGGS